MGPRCESCGQMEGQAMTGDSPPTTTVTPARVRLWEPTQRPTRRTGAWIETAWGRCRVTGRLGQRHADLLESMLARAEAWRERDGRIELLVDPARVRRALSDKQHSGESVRGWLDDLMAALVEIETPDWRIIGHIIDTVRMSRRTRPDPLRPGQRRHLWVVTLGDAMCELLRRDAWLRYDPVPIARLRHGISQAIARHILSHSRTPASGWDLDGLIHAVAGELSSQGRRDARRRLREDAEGLAALGIELRDGRVRLADGGD